MITVFFRRIFFKISDAFHRQTLAFGPGCKIGEGLVVRGRPMIQLSNGASIEIGRNVTLNSRNYGYHANMHSAVKLMADKPGAVIKIGANTRINGACLHAYNRIEIGENCLMAANVQIIDANGHELCFDDVRNRVNTSSEGKPIIIEDNVWLGLNAIILPGVRIGQGSVISANTVVTSNVPPMVVFAGNPGRVIKSAAGHD